MTWRFLFLSAPAAETVVTVLPERIAAALLGACVFIMHLCGFFRLGGGRGNSNSKRSGSVWRMCRSSRRRELVVRSWRDDFHDCGYSNKGRVSNGRMWGWREEMEKPELQTFLAPWAGLEQVMGCVAVANGSRK